MRRFPGAWRRATDTRMRIPSYDIVGFVGAALIIATYFANQQRWLPSADWRFPCLNLLGALLILASLYFEWNLPSVVIELFWIAISLWGLVKSLGERSH
jgi:hypothetical protein